MTGRNWRFVGVLLLLLADGAIAIAFRYRGELPAGRDLHVATAAFAGLVGILVIAMVIRGRMKPLWSALGFLTFTVTAAALVVAWTSLPCRFKSCEWLLFDPHLSYWSALSAALATAALWTFSISFDDKIGQQRWGLKAAGLAISVVVVALWTMTSVGPKGPGHFACSYDLIPYDAPDPSPLPTPAIASTANAC